MKLLMAVSRNGYVAKGPVDDMTWTGPDDKAVFKLLTSTGDILAASAQTVEQMPSTLEGRGQLYALSRDPRKGVQLEDLAPMAPNAWLLGGPTIAMYALRNGFVDRVFLSIVPAQIDVDQHPGAIEDQVRPYLEARGYRPGKSVWWNRSLRVTVGQVMVECWTRDSALNEEAVRR